MYILDLGAESAKDPVLVGGKAAALARISQGGFDVPPAQIITTAAYLDFLSQHAIANAIEQLRMARDNPLDLQRCVQELLRRLESATMPAELVRELTDESAVWRSLTPLAIRSSAMGEDSLSASFAGVYSSHLCVSSLDDLLRAIKLCWLSVWQTPAVLYREQRALDHVDTAMAVIIQQLVNADSSGIMFTRNPMTTDGSTVIVQAVLGLSDALAAGSQTPDEWLIDRRSGRVLEKRITGKTMRRECGGTAAEPTPVSIVVRNDPCLTPRQLRKVFATGLQLESLFGTDLDVEWALDHDKLRIVQARPITASFGTTTSYQGVSLRKRGYWTRRGFGEWFQNPLSPLFSSLLLPAMNLSTESLFKSRLGLEQLEPTWMVSDGYYYIRGDVKLTLRLLSLPRRFIRELLSVYGEWTTTVLPSYLEKLEGLKSLSSTVSAIDLVANLDEVAEIAADMWGWIVFTALFAKFSEQSTAYLANLLTHRTFSGQTDLTAGFVSTSVEADDELWRLANLAKTLPHTAEILVDADPSESLTHLQTCSDCAAWYGAFKGWLERFGHSIFDLDIAQETLGERPMIVLKNVRTLIRSDLPSPRDRSLGAALRRTAARSNLEKRIKRMFHSKLILRLARQWLDLVEHYASIRESRPYYLHLCWPLLRSSSLELGNRLVAAKALTEPNEVFFLSIDELRAAARTLDLGLPFDVRRKVVVRKRAQQRQLAAKPAQDAHAPPLLRLFDALSHTRGALGGDGPRLTGNAASPGVITGRARVVHSPSELGELRTGEILVTHYTTPAWTQAFSIASGILTETGGTLSHAAILSREYSIPAVLGVKNATSLISTGYLIQVDGAAGEVLIISRDITEAP